MASFREEIRAEQNAIDNENFIPLNTEAPKSVLDRFKSKNKNKT